MEIVWVSVLPVLDTVRMVMANGPAQRPRRWRAPMSGRQTTCPRHRHRGWSFLPFYSIPLEVVTLPVPNTTEMGHLT